MAPADDAINRRVVDTVSANFSLRGESYRADSRHLAHGEKITPNTGIGTRNKMKKKRS